MSTADDAAAYRPFDARATGYLPGEGGAVLLVEDLDRARERGAPRIYGEIAGYGCTNDACHPTDLPDSPRQLARAIRLALDDAGVGPEEHRRDVRRRRRARRPATRSRRRPCATVLGARAADVPVTVPKSMVGRLYAGGAALDVAGALLAIRDGRLPPTINLDAPANGDGLEPRHRRAAATPTCASVLVIARGYGGFNAALVVRRVD